MGIRSYIFIVLFASLGYCRGDEKPEYKMCIPDLLHQACLDLVENTPSTYATIRCVPARDRMECLDKVKDREADFLAVDPEDMYVAFQLPNQDFSVFSEIRTVVEPDARFRYEGIILVHKSSDIHNLTELSGKRSCHTGYGRNVGYKIPITKLKNLGILKVSTDRSMSPVEKELQGLSTLFSESCLVGTYSPSASVHQMLKKKYPNLCALCENPVKCNYPDKYSGYDGAIRCLVEKNADVAFTKTIYVRRYFGLPINGQPSLMQPQANPEDYEYLCEDGSRRPVTGPACSWAQRPWQGYMSNGDVNTRVSALQHRIQEFYEAGKLSNDRVATKRLWINETNLVVNKTEQVSPHTHLTDAKYKDVIERDGTMEQKIRWCVTTAAEEHKCNVLQKAAYSRDIRPAFECVRDSVCIQSMGNNQSDVVTLLAPQQLAAKRSHLSLRPVVLEKFKDHYLVVVHKDVSEEALKKSPIQYVEGDIKSRDAALKFNKLRGIRHCSGITVENSNVRVVRESELGSLENRDEYEFACSGSRQPIDTAVAISTECIYNATPPTGVFVRDSISTIELENLSHAFLALSEKFGRNGTIEDVFELFGQFESNEANVLFSDDASSLIEANPATFQAQLNEYDGLECVN